MSAVPVVSRVRRRAVAVSVALALASALVTVTLDPAVAAPSGHHHATTAKHVKHPRGTQLRLARPGSARAGHVTGHAAGRGQDRPSRSALLGAQPVLAYHGFADPTVVRYAGGWLGVSTGPYLPRAVATDPAGPWTDIGPALPVLPTWVTTPRVWAADLVLVDGVWVLYFAAQVGGLGSEGRCIGVATATDPTQTFVADERPLVCPREAIAPPAYDKVKKRGRDMPHTGVIDPEQFQDTNGKRYLLYRTQSTPASIRMVKLPHTGTAAGSPHQSIELVRRGGVIENPTMLRRHGEYELITSEGAFGKCGYKTTYRHSSDLKDWAGAPRQVLMDTSNTGLCGAGGADLARTDGGAEVLFFHAWYCADLATNCPNGHDYAREDVYGARRALYAVTLRFTKSRSPRLNSFVVPAVPPTSQVG